MTSSVAVFTASQTIFSPPALPSPPPTDGNLSPSHPTTCMAWHGICCGWYTLYVAPREGILTELLVPTGGEVSPLSPARGTATSTSATAKSPGKDKDAAVPVGRISFCGHPELHGTLCTSCGREVLPPGGNGSGNQDDGGGGGGGGGRDENDGDGGVGDTHQVLMKGGKMMSVTAEGKRGRETERDQQEESGVGCRFVSRYFACCIVT